jgi:thiamine-phosphate pyrophosphorylase
MLDHHAAVAALVSAHRQRLGLSPVKGEPAFTSDAPIYRAAKTASLRLGFIEADAECLGHAWQRMSDRRGAFDAHAWPTLPANFGMAPWPRARAFPYSADSRHLGLYAVLPDAKWVARMARAGVPTVQLRFKSADPAAIQSEVKAAVEAVRGTGTLLYINDHWRAAIDAGAHGVHLGQDDIDAADLEAIRLAGLRCGMSTHGYAEMVRVDRFTPSYIALGAVFPTTLKKMPTKPQGLGRLRAYADLMKNYPLVAIGGIDAKRIQAVMRCGVGSAAVVRAIVAAKDPVAAVAQLQELMCLS